MLPGNEKVKIAVVIFIVPFFVNVSFCTSFVVPHCSQLMFQVIMFWIVDSILMRKRSSPAAKEPSVHYHKPEVKYNKLKAAEESFSDCEVTVQTPTDLPKAGDSR